VQQSEWDSIPGRARYFSFLHSIRNGSRAHTVSYLCHRRAPSAGLKQGELESDHLSQFRAEVRNAGICIYTHPHILMVQCHKMQVISRLTRNLATHLQPCNLSAWAEITRKIRTKSSGKNYSSTFL
jgi:hypothetical protein